MGYEPHTIYYIIKNAEEAQGLIGRCRLIASSLEVLYAIDKIAAQEAPGSIASVGLQLKKPEYQISEGISSDEIQADAVKIRRLSSVSAAGCCMQLPDNLTEKEPGRIFRIIYETAKIVSTIIPCSMPYVFLKGSLPYLKGLAAKNPQAFEEALNQADIIGTQNKTAFYSKFLLS